MKVLDTTTDLDLITESWEAPHCESVHRDPANQTCTHTPVAIQTAQCGSGDLKVCLGHVQWHMETRRRSHAHTRCGNRWSECLNLIPL